MRVVAHGRSEQRLAALADDVERATGRRVDTVAADLAGLAEVDRLADTVLERYDALHVLVNNAGVGFGAPGGGRETSADGIELRFAVNHLAAYRLAHGSRRCCGPARPRGSCRSPPRDSSPSTPRTRSASRRTTGCRPTAARSWPR